MSTRHGGLFDLVRVDGVVDVVDVRATSDGAHVGYIQRSPLRLIPPRDQPGLGPLLQEIYGAAVALGVLPSAAATSAPSSQRGGTHAAGTT